MTSASAVTVLISTSRLSSGLRCFSLRCRPLLRRALLDTGRGRARVAVLGAIGDRRRYAASGGRNFALLLDLRRLTAQFAQVVQLGAPDVAAGHDLDLLHDRGVQREGPLDTDAEADLADREGLLQATTLAADHDTLEDLDAGPVALDDLDVHLHGVTGTEGRDVVTLARIVELVQDVAHQVSLSRACHRS